MLRIPLTLLLILLLSPLYFASAMKAVQPPLTYVRTWGGGRDDIAYGLSVDGSDNAYVTGYTSSFASGVAGAVALKLNSTGEMVWGRIWGGNESEVGFSLAVDQLGNTYVTGSTSSFVSGRNCGGLPCKDLFLLKFNATGDLIWQLTFGGSLDDVGYGVAVDRSGRIWVTGYTQSYGAGGQDVLLLEFTSDGILLRGETWGGNSSEVGYGVALDSAGSIYVAGFTSSFGAIGSDVLLLKFDSSASPLWQRTWGGSDSEEARGITLDPSGNVYVAGYTTSFGAGSQDAILLKFSSTGDLLWQRIWGTSGFDGGSAVSSDSSGKEVQVAGFTPNPSNGLSDALLLSFDSSGDLLGEETWGGTGEDYSYGLATDSAGDIFAAGSVSEAPPYSLGAVSNPSVETSGPNASSLSVGAASLPLSITTPHQEAVKASSSNSYAGAADLFLIKQPPPSSLGYSPVLVVIAFASVVPIFLNSRRMLRKLKDQSRRSTYTLDQLLHGIG